jgi:hypothetical protein
MKERPILFSGPMVRAILDGSKTQTRRIFKGTTEHKGPYNPAYMETHQQANGWGSICPYGTPGDRLWVRETWAVQHEYDAAAPSEIGASARWHYAATEDLGGLRKRPSIFLPRRGSRILLEITDVRVQRLQEISEEDARAEGCEPFAYPRDRFHGLWDTIHGSGAWHANPWIWAITFRRIQP